MIMYGKTDSSMQTNNESWCIRKRIDSDKKATPTKKMYVCTLYPYKKKRCRDEKLESNFMHAHCLKGTWYSIVGIVFAVKISSGFKVPFVRFV